jgi:hypothetical protein
MASGGYSVRSKARRLSDRTTLTTALSAITDQERGGTMRTTLILVTALILLLAFTSSVMAQNVKMKDNPKCEQWHSVGGEWTGEGEFRTGPDEPWTKVTGKLQVDWILDGSFIQARGQNSFGVSFISTIGYDARLKTHVSSAFNSSGGRAMVTSGGWSGTTLTLNFTHFSPDGRVTPLRATLEYNSDFKSATARWESFTDGKWWTSEKGKQTKVK